jgi:hypothetical protein
MGSLDTNSSAFQSPFLHQLSPADHLSPRVHTTKLFYFASEAPASEIIETLHSSLAKSLEAFPILSGTIGLLKNAPQKGTLAVQGPVVSVSETLSTSDLTQTYDFDVIAAKHFHPKAVDTKLVVPDLCLYPTRVFLAQANIIRGGVILSIALHHNVADEGGIFMTMKLWSTFCRGDDGAKLITPAWTDNSSLMKGEGTGRLEDHPEYKVRPAEDSVTGQTANQEYMAAGSTSTTGTATLFFSESSLESLKKSALIQPLPSGSSEQVPSWISTNDALCALIWSRVTKARDLGEDVPYSMFNMTVDGRSRVEPALPAEYIGNVVFVTTKAILRLETLASPNASLPEVALSIRNSVLAVDNAAIKDKIKAAASIDDIGRLAPGGYSSQQRHFACTSWSGHAYYALDWGKVLGGRCRRVRFPKSLGDGVCVIFPRISQSAELGFDEAGLEVQIGLEGVALGKLREDEILNRYAKWQCI